MRPRSKGHLFFHPFQRVDCHSSAAFLLGSYCHAFELDNLRATGAGVHLVVIMWPLVALAREYGLSGRKLASAVVGVKLSRQGWPQSTRLKIEGLCTQVIGPVGGAIAMQQL